MSTRVCPGWDNVELGDIVTLHRGYDLPSGERRDGLIPVVSSSGITGFHSEAKVCPPGVVTGRYGTLGKVFFIDEPFWPLNTTLYVSDFHGNDERFVSYLLRCQNLGARDGASAVPGVNRNVLHRLPVMRPPMGAQRKIAAVLSAYDELIENNNRRIKLLEEMAQRVYREWFVDFRYPGNEGVPLVDSELGLIPEGWKVERIADRFEVVLGGTPSRKNLHYWLNGTVPWINSGQVNRLRVIGASEMITPEALKSSSTKLMPRGTTLLAITGATLGQVSLLEIEACANQSVVGIYDQLGELTEYLYLAIGNSIESIIGAASGGAQQHINQQNVKETLITVPSTEIGAEFQLRVRPLFSLLANLLKANQRLSDCRDLLLPRLVSGEIDVSKLDITMTEATA